MHGLTPPITVSSAAVTHPGRKREMNEDSYIAAHPFFLVADGMGGHAAGDVASATVAAEFAAIAGAHTVSVDLLRAAIDRARVRVDALSDGPRPAGTTLTGVCVSEVGGYGYWLVVNIGDSRTYRFADGKLEQLTVDHSAVQELLSAGAAAQAAHVSKNVITRAIGAGSTAHPDVWMIPAAPNDRMLVCSDGLSNEVEDDEIAQLLETLADPAEAANTLVERAVEHGGRDNITVIIADATAVMTTDDDDTAPVLPGEVDEDTLPRAALV